MTGKKFSDEEVREILAKAVEDRADRLSSGEGTSLAELKEIGAEAGIDPDRIEDAARSVMRREAPGVTARHESSTFKSAERTVPGEIDPDATFEAVSIIRRGMRQQGEVSDVHGTIEWRSRGETGERLVSLSTRDGATTISGSSDLRSLAVLTYLPAGLVGLITSIIGFTQAADAGNEVGIVICMLLVPTLMLVLRTIFGRISDGEARRLETVVNELAELVESGRSTSDLDGPEIGP